MPIKLDKFGSTALPGIETKDFINSKEVLAVPKDPRLESLLTDSRNANPQISSTLPDGSKPTDKNNLNTIEQKIYQAVAQGNELASKITGPLQKFYSTVDDVNESIDAVKGVIGERGAIQRAINQASQLVGLDVFSLKKENKYVNQELNTEGGVTAPLNYPYPRIAWEITTQWRLLQGLKPIKFYVNPASMTIAQTQVLQKDFVQKGYMMNSWKDINVESGNRFAHMDVGFNFQSSNIIPESYVKTDPKYSGISNTANALEILKQTVGIDQEAINIDGEYSIPPGLLNFFDILTIFHEDKTISKLKMYTIPNSLNDNSPLDGVTDLSQIKQDQLNSEIERLAGIPNYVYLSISTRIWPRMTLRGFFEGGYSINESANDPFKFETQLKFIAFDSDPAWWDPTAIKNAYLNFYKKASSKLGDKPTTEITPVVKETWVIPTDIYKSAAQASAAKFAMEMIKTPLEPISELDSLPVSNENLNNPFDNEFIPEVVNEEEYKKALDNATIAGLNQGSVSSSLANVNLNQPFSVDNLGQVNIPIQSVTDITSASSKKSQSEEFKQAFEKARKELGPNKTFEFKGKRYSTNYKEEENKQSVTPTVAATSTPKTTVDSNSATGQGLQQNGTPPTYTPPSVSSQSLSSSQTLSNARQVQQTNTTINDTFKNTPPFPDLLLGSSTNKVSTQISSSTLKQSLEKYSKEKHPNKYFAIFIKKNVSKTEIITTNLNYSKEALTQIDATALLFNKLADDGYVINSFPFGKWESGQARNLKTLTEQYDKNLREKKLQFYYYRIEESNGTDVVMVVLIDNPYKK